MQQTHLIRHSFGAPNEGKSLIQDCIGLGWNRNNGFWKGDHLAYWFNRWLYQHNRI
jgi:hypothetical protein